eukprot:272374_1
MRLFCHPIISSITIFAIICTIVAVIENRNLKHVKQTDVDNNVHMHSIAEFDQMKGVLIRYPFGIPLTIITEILFDENIMIYCLISASNVHMFTNKYNTTINLSRIKFIITETDTYWTRDYGPFWIQLNHNKFGIVDFEYNRPNRINDNNIAYQLSQYFNVSYISSNNILNTGGNYMTDGCDTAAASQIIYSENDEYCSLEMKTINFQVHPHLPTCHYIDTIMRKLLGIKHFYVFDDPNKLYINHIDCWCKFLSTDKIIIKQFHKNDIRYEEMENIVQYWGNTSNTFGKQWKIYRIYTPNDEPYINSFMLNYKVFVPLIYNNSLEDQNALQVYKNALLDWEVLGFHSHIPIEWQATDSIHCRIKGIPDFKYIANRMHDICYESEFTTQHSKYIIVTIDGYTLLHLGFILFVFSCSICLHIIVYIGKHNEYMTND